MALSYQAETSDGTLKRVILGIDFFDTSDIYVTQGDRPLSTPADYQWDGRTAINLTEVVPAGVLLMVRRKTDNTVTRLKFSQGAPFVRENIDAQNKQFLFLAQEASEGAFGDLYNNLNMHGFRIFNLAEPIDDRDAATKGWAVRTFSGIYNEYLALCKHEADRAVDAANRASVSASKAAVSEKNAKDSEVAAKNSETIADARASNAYDSELAAKNSATASANSATASEASAVRAENAADAITGAILDGGACDLSGGVYPPPLEIKGKKYSTVWAVTVGGTVEGTVYLAGDGLRYTINGDYYFRVDVTGEVKAQITAHEKKVDAHPISGVKGLSKALQGKQNVSDAYEEAPFPDVWVPFNDGLTMLAGFGDYDRVYIGDEYLELNSRSVNFERATTATYIDKSGVLRTAAINEPRFEKQGLLIEGQSTNLCRVSEPVSTSVAPWVSASNVALDGINPRGETSKCMWRSNTPTQPYIVVTVSPSTKHCMSWLSREGGANYLRAAVYDVTNAAFIVSATSIPVVGTHWRRVTIEFTTPAACTSVRLYPCRFDSSAELDKDFYVYGVQLEALPIASSYIPTSGATVTRVADKCWIPYALNVPPLRTGAPMTIAVNVDFIGLKTSGFQGIYSEIGNAGNLLLRYEGENTQVRAYRDATSFPTEGIVANKEYISAMRVSNADVVSVSLNGNIYSSIRSAVPIAQGLSDTLQIGCGQGNGDLLFGHIRNFRIWHRALSDRQIRGLK